MNTLFTTFLKAQRLAAGGISAGEAADRSCVSENTWRQYEAGSRPGASGLLRLSDHFGVPAEKLKEMASTPCTEDHFTKHFVSALDGLV